MGLKSPRLILGTTGAVRRSIYYRFLSTGNSIDGQRPETTAGTNPVCWQIELRWLRRALPVNSKRPANDPPDLGLQARLFGLKRVDSEAKFRGFPVFEVPAFQRHDFAGR